MLQKPGKSDHVFTPTKLAAIIDTVVAGGVSPTHALAGVGVSPAELLSPDTRVSLSISAFLTHSLSGCAAQPILAAIQVTVPNREG